MISSTPAPVPPFPPGETGVDAFNGSDQRLGSSGSGDAGLSSSSRSSVITR